MAFLALESIVAPGRRQKPVNMPATSFCFAFSCSASHFTGVAPSEGSKGQCALPRGQNLHLSPLPRAEDTNLTQGSPVLGPTTPRASKMALFSKGKKYQGILIKYVCIAFLKEPEDLAELDCLSLIATVAWGGPSPSPVHHESFWGVLRTLAATSKPLSAFAQFSSTHDLGGLCVCLESSIPKSYSSDNPLIQLNLAADPTHGPCKIALAHLAGSPDTKRFNYYLNESIINRIIKRSE